MTKAVRLEQGEPEERRYLSGGAVASITFDDHILPGVLKYPFECIPIGPTGKVAV
jgi:hypothetical protein